MAKIQVIEDEPFLLQALENTFLKEGFKVIASSNGVTGLTDALKNHPDLILLDMILPEKNGIEVLKALRQDDWGKTTPVIVLSNSKDDDQIDETEKLGVEAYLVKTDWELEGIVEKVKIALNL